MMVDIVTREQWGARPPAKHPHVPTTVRELYLHHTVGAGTVDLDDDGDYGDDYMRSVQRFHQDGRGWNDIAYNFLIDPDGLEVYEGRGWGFIPGSQRSHNSGTWSVAIMGDFRNLIPDDRLLTRIADLVRFGQEEHGLPHVPLRGHRDAPGSAGNHCPGGFLYARLATINQLIKEGDDMRPPAWAEPATQWHIDRGIYSGATPDDVDESEEFHRQTVFRYRFYNSIRNEFGSGDPHTHAINVTLA